MPLFLEAKLRFPPLLIYSFPDRHFHLLKMEQVQKFSKQQTHAEIDLIISHADISWKSTEHNYSATLVLLQ